jgi:hypothetical protein
MKLDTVYQATDKFLNQMLRGRHGIDYDLTLDKKLSEEEEKPMFNLRVLIDPEKYHWSGYEYSSKYVHTIDYIEDYLDQTLKYIGLSADNFNSIDLRFDPKKVKNYYERIVPEIPRIWKIFQERMSGETKVPNLKQVDILKRDNGDYDLKFHLDKTNLSSTEELQRIEDYMFHMFFVVAADHGLPMDSHFIEFV